MRSMQRWTWVAGLGVLAAAACLAAPAQYKQVHRDMVTRLAGGQADRAIAEAQAYLEKNPDDLESPFILAVAYTQKGDLATAMTFVKKAVEGGLPIDRFVAGPRDLLAPLVESDAFKAFTKGFVSPLVHGPMVGSVTDSSARFWVRTAGEADVRIVCVAARGQAGAPSEAKVGTGRTRKADDYTAVVEVTGLAPFTTYHYDVSVDGRAMTSEPFAFRTFPKAGSPAKFNVVFGGGAGYTPQHEHMWNTVGTVHPLALLMLGDNVYIDTPKVPATQQYCYYRRQSRLEWRNLVAATGVFAIYDDHDFFDNDCIPGPDIDKPPYKRDVWRLFTQNWANPSYGGGPEQPGCWYTFSIGNVDIFMMDCRFYRTLDSKPPTMLGPVEKRWLKAALAKSKGTFRVLASSVPWAYGAKPGSKDPWQGYKEEREELFSFLAKEKIGGVVLISADRHRSDLWKIERPDGYALYEFSSSRLTNIHTHPVMKESLYGYNKTCSFGLLEFDTTAADPTVTYKIVSIDGEVMHTFTLKRSQLADGS